MSNFKCPHCGMINIDCGKDGYKTPKEIRYEEKLEKIKRFCINKEEARLLYGCGNFDFYKVIQIIESEK